jgi:hypothetical protein
MELSTVRIAVSRLLVSRNVFVGGRISARSANAASPNPELYEAAAIR